MKKLLPNANLLALLLGGCAVVLRMWMLLGGTDDRGLYPRYHPAWILLCLLTLAAVALFWVLSRQIDPRRSYRRNFPASPVGAFGCLAGGVGMALTAIFEWRESGGPAAGVLGLLCAGVMAYGGWLRLRGKRPHFLVHMLPCLYLALRIFLMGRILGAEPEMSRFLFRFLAILASLMATYQLWGFDVGLGDRKKSLFWSLTAIFLCLAAVPGSPDRLLQLGLALWLSSNLCALTPLRRVRRSFAPVPPDPRDEALARFLAEEDDASAPPEQPAPEEEPPAPQPERTPEDMDTDELIAWALEGLEGLMDET